MYPTVARRLRLRFRNAPGIIQRRRLILKQRAKPLHRRFTTVYIWTFWHGGRLKLYQTAYGRFHWGRSRGLCHSSRRVKAAQTRRISGYVLQDRHQEVFSQLSRGAEQMWGRQVLFESGLRRYDGFGDVGDSRYIPRLGPVAPPPALPRPPGLQLSLPLASLPPPPSTITLPLSSFVPVTTAPVTVAQPLAIPLPPPPAPVPEKSPPQRIIEPEDFARAVNNPDLCREFVKIRKGWRMPLTWPKNYTLWLETEAELRMPVGEISRLSQEYLCCPEDLIVLGGVRRSTGDNKNEDLGVLFAGEEGRVYIYAPDVDDAIYLVGDSPEGFIKRGLRRFYPIYREIETDGCSAGVTEYLERLTKSTALSIAKFSATYPGTVFSLPWPTGAYIKTIPPRRRKFVTGRGSDTMVYFAAVIGRYLDPVFREVLLAVNEKGAIFSYNPWDDEITKICEGVMQLFTLGLRGIKKNYRFRARLPVALGDRPPKCPHVSPVFFTGQDLCGENSTLRCLGRSFNLLAKGGSENDDNNADINKVRH
ncbi:m25.1 [Muromegalovirus WP15B]|uniref:M25.1 n=1 Tax=Muromegalovirus WP15B TaxID=524651 RepID=B3UXF3_MUHV1|nr:m25.1 [Muromegalovirus WP15B]